MKKIILGLLGALSLVAGFSAVAEAKTNFNLYLGVPYYDYQVGRDYLFDENHGWDQQDSQSTYQPAHYTGTGRQVCLVTFFRRDQVRAGADINVQRARLLPLRAAQRLDRPNDVTVFFTTEAIGRLVILADTLHASTIRIEATPRNLYVLYPSAAAIK